MAPLMIMLVMGGRVGVCVCVCVMCGGWVDVNAGSILVSLSDYKIFIITSRISPLLAFIGFAISVHNAYGNFGKWQHFIDGMFYLDQCSERATGQTWL